MRVMAHVAGMAVCGAASAGIEVVPIGPVAPPSELGGIGVAAFPFDARIFADVLSIPDGCGREITTEYAMSCRLVGEGWATWSHGYAGNVYTSNGGTRVTVLLPRGTRAFYLYAEPGPFGQFPILMRGSDGISTAELVQIVEGRAGAAGWGFHASDGSDIVSIEVVVDQEFAIGEFGISAPCPADLDGDGFVDFTDFLLFLNYYEAADPKVDYTEDGLVDFADYLQFLNWYGNSCEDD